MRDKENISSVFYKIIIGLFGIMILMILGMNIIFSQGMDYVCKNNVTMSNGVLLILGIIGVLVLGTIYNIFFRRRINKLSKRECNILLIVACIILLIIQLYIAYNIYFLSGWDVSILRNTSTDLANQQLLNSQYVNYGYFTRYPNNVFLTFIFTIIKEVAIFLKIENLDFSLVVISVLLVNISAWFITKSAAIIFKNRYYSVLTLFIYSIYIALSPWITIPYSDSYSIIFTTAVLYFYLNRKNMNEYLAWSLIFILSLIGYLIKPTCIIILIAIMLVEFWKFVFYSNKRKLRCTRFLLVLLSCMIVFLTIKNYSNNYIGYEENEADAFPLTHFLMMGMNPVTKGVYYEDDVMYTASFIGKEEKIKANLEMVKKRLEDYGISGYFKLLGEKLMTNYNDGTFAWSVEGGFYLTVLEAPNNSSAKILRDIYYYDGLYYKSYATYQQSIWITILFFILLAVKRIVNTDKRDIYVIVLAIIGITLFLLLFEARARYLFLYSPYYILLAVIGIQSFIAFMHKKLSSK